MRFSIISAVTVALAAEGVVGSSWFSKAAYNKWHETELERWLSDNNIPYPTPADRKDLENKVKDNWNSVVGTPYKSWDANQLSSYLNTKGTQVKKGTEKNKDSLIQQVQQSWTETEEQASDSYSSVQNWIFNSWSESQLKAFLDKHGIPNPQPRTRDTYVKAARENYQSAANKLGEYTGYPGNWLYESWSESDLKAFLDERGIPAPQPSSRDKLIASVRRNARTAALQMQDTQASASSSAANAQQTLTDQLINAWGDSQLKQWLDEQGVKVPQGSKRNELLALARKQRSNLAASAQSGASSASSYLGAASSNAGNQYAKATDDASLAGNDLYHQAMSYVDWARAQLGLGGGAQASFSSATGAAAKSMTSASNAASSKAARASADASRSAKSAAGKEDVADQVADAYNKATDAVKDEL